MPEKEKIPRELVDQANETDLVSFLESQGEEVRQEHNFYRWSRHDSVLIKESKITGLRNVWIQNSTTQTRKYEYPVSFLMKFYGMKFREAVYFLLNRTAAYVPDPRPKDSTHKQTSKFSLPEKDSNNDSIIKYLTGRGVSLEVINYYIDKGDLYQKKGRWHNVIFVGRDSSGTPQYYFERGLHDWTDREGKLHKFRHEPEGTDRKRFNFARTGTNNKLCLFESCIDLMSFQTLFPDSCRTHLLSCGGTGSEAFEQYVSDHPEIDVVFLCFDRDQAGNNAEKHYKQIIPASVRLIRMTPTKYKDWNELLQHSESVQKLYEIEQQ